MPLVKVILDLAAILDFYFLPKTSDVARAGRGLYEPCFVRYKCVFVVA